MEKRKWTKEEIEEYRKTHGAFFYFNKEDSIFSCLSYMDSAEP
jgi:hypothetical protein